MLMNTKIVVRVQIIENPEPGKNPEKLQKSGIFLENPQDLATLATH